MAQTTNPLIQMMIPAAQKAWAIFADCTGIFDADDDKKDQSAREPIIRTIQSYVAIDTLANNGLPIRVVVAFFFGGLMQLPKELTDKNGQFVIATKDEVRLFAASDFQNLVATTSEERPIEFWRERCVQKRAEVKKKIATTLTSPLIIPGGKGLLGVDGNPVN